ncbi:MAG: hypothetical protein MI744_06835 [Pseudomonadales bacterium]|nr:hypothetical protein [Pseudomonadales bacterium]
MVTSNEQEHLRVIDQKLDRLDEAIRGNGKLGIILRLDRLEQNAKRQSKLIWLLIGAMMTAGASSLAIIMSAWLSGGGG